MERRGERQHSVNRATRKQEAIAGAVNAVDERYAHLMDLSNRLEKTLKRGTVTRHGKEIGLTPEQRQRRVVEMDRLNAKLAKRRVDAVLPLYMPGRF